MAARVTLTTLVLIAWLTIQATTGPSHAEEGTDELEKPEDNLVDGLDWVLNAMGMDKGFSNSLEEKEGKQLKTEELSEKDRTPRQLGTEETQVEAEPEEIEEIEGENRDPEGRLFFGTGATGPTITLNLSSVQSVLSGILLVAISVFFFVLLISLITGKDIYTLTKGFTDGYAYPPYDYGYYPPNHHYRDDSTYTSYRAFEEAAKKYD